MILIDALHINDGGGKILLDYLIDNIEKSNLRVYYLLDGRIRNRHPIINENKIFYLAANFKNRHCFYKREGFRFSKVLCFGNLPPTIKLKATVYTYFHQKLFIEIPKNLPLKLKLALMVKSKILFFLKKNTDFWIVQTQLMKSDLVSKFKINKEIVYLIPFYPSLISDSKTNITRIKKTFLYVSNYNPHKNYENLLNGFMKHYDENKSGELHLTLNEDKSNIIKKIKEIQNRGYPVINHGFVSKDKLLYLYNSSEYIIYPSLLESFGLGIIEGIENGCKVIGSNQKYTMAVCIPSFVFNPLSVKDIAESFNKAISGGEKNSKQLVFNEIKDLMSLLNNLD